MERAAISLKAHNSPIVRTFQKPLRVFCPANRVKFYTMYSIVKSACAIRITAYYLS